MTYQLQERPSLLLHFKIENQMKIAVKKIIYPWKKAHLNCFMDIVSYILVSVCGTQCKMSISIFLQWNIIQRNHKNNRSNFSWKTNYLKEHLLLDYLLLCTELVQRVLWSYKADRKYVFDRIWIRYNFLHFILKRQTCATFHSNQ